MSGLEFKRPIGAGADLKELEYVIALQQTSMETRDNATLSSHDVLALLRSRYALTNISHEQAVSVVRSLGGGDTVVSFQQDNDDVSNEGGNRAGSKTKEALHNLWDHLHHPSNTNSHHHSRNNEETEGGGLNTTAETGDTTENDKQSGGLMKNFFLWSHFQSKEDNHSALKPTTTTPQTKQQQNDVAAEIAADRRQKMQDLHRLQKSVGAMNPAAGTTHKSLRDLQTDLTQSLKRQVWQNTTKQKSKSNLRNIDANQSNHESIEVYYSNDDDNNSNPASPEQAPAPVKTMLSTVQEDEPSQPSSNDGNQHAEFLDLVQILTTILIPIFARMTLAPERRSSSSENDDDYDSEERADVCTNIFNKLIKRFINYGRRKLRLDEDAPAPLPSPEETAHSMLEMGHSSLLKNVMLDDENDENGLGTDSDDFPVIDETLVQLLLLQHGEIERANNAKLVKEMVVLANRGSKSGGYLDEQALLFALTSDLVPPWDAVCEDTPTSFFYDVFGRATPSVRTKLVAEPEVNEAVGGGTLYAEERVISVDDDEDVGISQVAERNERIERENKFLEGKPRRGVFDRCFEWAFPVIYANFKKEGNGPIFLTTFAGFDMAVDLSASLAVHILIWLSYLLISGVYISLAARSPRLDVQCPSDNAYWCTLFDKVVSWIIVAGFLISYGIFYMVPVTIGNNAQDRSVRRNFFACFWVVLNNVGLFAGVNWMNNNPSFIANAVARDTMGTRTYTQAQVLTLVIGLALAAFFFSQGFFLLCSRRIKHHPHQMPGLLKFFVSTAYWDGEARVYQAAQQKTQRMVENAICLHGSSSQLMAIAQGQENKLSRTAKLAILGAEDQTMQNFVLHGEKTVAAGGLVWSWWKLFDGSLFVEEGIWLNNRLWAIQAGQVIVGSFLGFFLIFAVVEIANAAGDFRDDIQDDDLPDWVMEIFPTSAMIHAALTPAAIVAIISMAVTCILYIPSAVATVLKYRGQLMPSLGSPYFEKYRMNIDMTYMNMSNAIYGMLGSASLIYVVVGLVIFLYVWPITQEFALLLTVWGIGLGITIMAKMFITKVCRRIQYRSYYRIRPVAARITSLALECWFIGLAGSVLIARVAQVLGAALFWMGRIDVPFLSEDVRLFGYAFDYVPTHFFKDLLVHEAHRHPYIERLSSMYLMKLRHGDTFVSEAGSAWRQLVILAIFPWMAKYRIFSEERRRNALVEAGEKEQMMEREKQKFIGTQEMAADVRDTGQTVGGEAAEVGHELYGAGTDIVNEVVETGKSFTNRITKRMGNSNDQVSSD